MAYTERALPMNVTLTHHSEYLASGADDDVPSGLPLYQMMDKVQGYENVSFYVEPLTPPAYDHANRGQPLSTPSNGNANHGQPASISRTLSPMLTEHQARETLLNFVSKHCCYGKSAAEEMVFRSIENVSAFHYNLKTFGESRQMYWMAEPYVGQPIDSQLNGPAPSLWEIEVATPAAYEETRMKTEVPHTASVKPCPDCAGTGKRQCPICHGFGNLNTYDGPGSPLQMRSCTKCYDQGRITCASCLGNGKLKCYIVLSLSWKNHEDEIFVKHTSLPDDLIRAVNGQLAFEEDLPRVAPINDFPELSVNITSTNLIQQHDTNYSMERIIRQRQRVQIVPVSQVFYTWKEKTNYFFVYGFENNVYAPNYPQKCCGCCIL